MECHEGPPGCGVAEKGPPPRSLERRLALLFQREETQVNYVGIDWAYGRAAFCSMDESGSIEAEGMIPASEDGLAGWS